MDEKQIANANKLADELQAKGISAKCPICEGVVFTPAPEDLFVGFRSVDEEVRKNGLIVRGLVCQNCTHVIFFNVWDKKR